MTSARAARLAAVVLALSCRPSSTSTPTRAAPAPTARVLIDAAGGTVAVRAEVARTPEEQRRGLMFRTRLDPDAGMIFVFGEEKPHGFWMENTLVPLDMLFLTADGRVAAIVERAPLDRASNDGGVASRYVLEVVQGWSRAHGVKVGDRVRFEGVLY